jgi:putative transposase
MLRGQKVFFRASKADLDRLYACNRESARVWNECLRLAIEHSLQHGGWITKSELQKQTNVYAVKKLNYEIDSHC